jgi:hypothetical protein
MKTVRMTIPVNMIARITMMGDVQKRLIWTVIGHHTGPKRQADMNVDWPRANNQYTDVHA